MSETIYVHLKIPKNLKKQLKHASIEQEKTMSDIVVDALNQYFKSEK